MAYTIFTINETAWVFSPQKFNSLLEKKKIKGSNKNGRRISNAQIYNELSELIHISPDAIKKWKLGKNSFSDENYLRLLAQYFDVDKTDLLVPVTNNENKSVIRDLVFHSPYTFTNVFYEIKNSADEKDLLNRLSLQSINFQNVFRIEGLTVQDMSIISELQQYTKADPYYIQAFFDSKAGEAALNYGAGGSAVMTISAEAVKGIMIPLPTLEEQKKIGQKYQAVLDEYTVLKRKMKKLLERKRTLLDNEG